MKFDEIKNGGTYDLLEINTVNGNSSGLDDGRIYKLDNFLDDAGTSHQLIKMISTRDDYGNPMYSVMIFEIMPNFTYEFTEPDELPDTDAEAPDNSDYYYETTYDVSDALEGEKTKEKINDAFKEIEQAVSDKNANASRGGVKKTKKTKKTKKSKKNKKTRKSKKNKKTRKSKKNKKTRKSKKRRLERVH